MDSFGEHKDCRGVIPVFETVCKMSLCIAVTVTRAAVAQEVKRVDCEPEVC